MNAMMFVCGNDRDYDSWASQGNAGWDYNSILPFIRKFENNTDIKNNFHGTGGPLTVTNYRSSEPFAEVLREAFMELGYKQLRDYNSREYNGFVEFQGTIKDGERNSAARAFLLPIKNRSNLYIMKNSFVSHVLFNGSAAMGVNIKTSSADCPNIKALASKEVIVSAGTFGSTKLLLKSGIGLAADLLPFGIKQVKNLPVGENLQDHVNSVHFIKVNPDAPTRIIHEDVMDGIKYYFGRNGPHSNMGLMNYNGIINTKDVNATYPEIQYIPYRFFKGHGYLLEILTAFGFKDEFIAAIVEQNKKSELIMIFAILLNPKSRGTVKLRSSDPFAAPIIHSGYFTAAEDVDTLLRGIDKLTSLIKTKAMKKTSAEFMKFDLNECNLLSYPSDGYWRCYIKYFSFSMWHPIGTCKMGPQNDSTAVVNDRLKVHGISNLRVADASIMPSVTTGNTQCPTFMIGEKASDMIKADWA